MSASTPSREITDTFLGPVRSTVVNLTPQDICTLIIACACIIPLEVTPTLVEDELLSRPDMVLALRVTPTNPRQSVDHCGRMRRYERAPARRHPGRLALTVYATVTPAPQSLLHARFRSSLRMIDRDASTISSASTSLKETPSKTANITIRITVRVILQACERFPDPRRCERS